jgi:CHAD domain-containing protein
MTKSFVERELKFDVDPGFAVPELDELLPPGGRVENASEHLRSDYFDTADHALLHAQMTLRRRTGTTDVGWQLKIPHAPFREEIHSELGSDGEAVPEELRRLLLGATGGQELAPIASVITERAVTRLVDADGRRLAEIDDDTVHASASGDRAATVSMWREVEVELGDDEVELLYALGKRLRRAGARRSSSSSKLARALPAAPGPTTNKRRSGPRAGDVIRDYSAEQRLVMLAGDLALRRGDDTVIHKTRVATRRLRSTLRVFGRLFDPDCSAELDGELRWYAALLGDVRDGQVLQRRLDAMVADLDDTVRLGPVQARIDSELRRAHTEHWQRLQTELTSDRYLALLASVTAWVRQPPSTPAARRPAGALKKMVRRAERKVSRKLRRANATGDVHLLHQARKSAKRARYSAEAAQPVIGKKRAKSEAKRYRKLQDLLGEHQDSIVSAELLRRLGAKAGPIKGENGFAFGILHEREEHNARTARTKARKTAKRYA